MESMFALQLVRLRRRGRGTGVEMEKAFRREKGENCKEGTVNE